MGYLSPDTSAWRVHLRDALRGRKWGCESVQEVLRVEDTFSLHILGLRVRIYNGVDQSQINKRKTSRSMLTCAFGKSIQEHPPISDLKGQIELGL